MKITNPISLLICLLLSIPTSVQSQWMQTILPGSRGGGVYSICVKDSLLFAGTDAGVYRSSDNGDHWKKVSPLLPRRSYNSKVYSIVANGNYVIAAFYRHDVYISSDEGETWTCTGLETQLGARCAPTEITASGNWIIGAKAHNVFGNIYLIQSTDNGISWDVAENTIGTGSAAIQDSIALAGSSSGIYRTSDYGLTWINVKSLGLNSFHYSAAVAFSGSHAYAGFGDLLSLKGKCYIYSSTDKGITWSPDSAVLNCNAINSIIISPANLKTNFVFAATDSGVFRSSDYGANWIAMNQGLNSNLVFSLVFKTKGTDGTTILFAGTGNGIFRSTDYGETWSVSGSPSNWTYASSNEDIFAVSSNGAYLGYSKEDKILNYSYQNTVYHSTDDGISWTEKYSGYFQDSSQVYSLVVGSNGVNGFNLFAGGRVAGTSIASQLYSQSSLYCNIFSSTNNGTSWLNVYADTLKSYSNIVLGANSSHVFASQVRVSGGTGMYSADNGGTWIKMDSSLKVVMYPDSISQLYPSVPWICTFAFEGNTVYAGGSDRYNTIIPPRSIKVFMINTVVFSTDNGASWTKVDSIPIGREIRSDADTISSLTSIYASGQHLLIGTKADYLDYDPYNYPTVNGGILYHLFYNGSYWTLVNSAFIGKSVFGLAAYNSNIYAATECGVYQSTDYGTTWNDISLGMNNIRVGSFFISGSYLYASTANGLWKRPLSEITSVSDVSYVQYIPEKYSLSQNFPNPFNPTTQIKYSIPHNSNVALIVYNLLGQKVATLFEGIRQPGNYEAVFDGSKLASGVYFYRLKAADFTETKKLILMK